MTQVNGQQYKVSAASTNQFTLTDSADQASDFTGNYTAMDSNAATAEKVVRIIRIYNAGSNKALIETDGDHGLDNSVHNGQILALFDLEDMTGSDDKKYTISSVPNTTYVEINFGSDPSAAAGYPEVCADNTCGTLRLSTGDLAVTSTGDAIGTALSALDGAGTITVTRKKDAESPSWSGGYMYRVTFATAPGDIGELYVSTSALTGTGATVTVGSEANPNSASPSSNGGFERDANQIGGTFLFRRPREISPLLFLLQLRRRTCELPWTEFLGGVVWLT